MFNANDLQYHQLLDKIYNHGYDSMNERTGKFTRAIFGESMEYHSFPLLTLRKSYWRAAIAELIGYIRGYDNAEDFRKLGCNTWNANANDNSAWLANPARKGEDDMGRVYGVQGRSWTNSRGESFDQFMKIYNNLSQGIDDRGEILSFYNPGEFHLGCLRPCMHTHTFGLLDGTLFLESNQRSCDVPLGLNFNMVQCWAFLNIMAVITSNKVGFCKHNIANAHIYEDQLDQAAELLNRTSTDMEPVLHVSPDLTLDILLNADNVMDYFTVVNYTHRDPIDFAFSV